ncbi:MAG: hypothetical protein ACP5G2_04495 [Candidatus Bipolaricaulaceae bacterium]
MKWATFFPLSLVAVLLCAATAPVAPQLRGGAGLALLLLWGYGLWRARGPGLPSRSPVRLLPGHALLFLALGVAGAEAGLGAWLAVPPLTIALDAALRGRSRSLAAGLYAILWLDLFAAVHQLVALGRSLEGFALGAWSAGWGALALGFVGVGTWRTLRAAPRGAEEKARDIG